jgi:RNA methyltransferase, TrmH family
MSLIQSRENPRFKQIKRLAESGRERKKQGKTLLDGVHLIQAYELQFGPVEALFVAESARHSPEIADYTAGRDWLLLADNLMRDLGLVDTPSGLLAVIPQPPVVTVDPAIDSILLDGVQDPGNVGTLLRTAAAAGCRQALLSSTCASAWSPKVLRAGQGAHFAISIVEDADLPDFVANFRGATVATSLDEAVPLYAAEWNLPVAWIFGSEGAGVSKALSEAASLRVRIPMPGAVESLNVSAAAAVCLFEALRRRLA